MGSPHILYDIQVCLKLGYATPHLQFHREHDAFRHQIWHFPNRKWQCWGSANPHIVFLVRYCHYIPRKCRVSAPIGEIPIFVGIWLLFKPQNGLVKDSTILVFLHPNGGKCICIYDGKKTYIHTFQHFDGEMSQFFGNLVAGGVWLVHFGAPSSAALEAEIDGFLFPSSSSSIWGIC